MTINDFQLIHYLISIRSGVNELYEHETRSSSNCHNSSPYTAQTRVTEYAYKLSQLQKKIIVPNRVFKILRFCLASRKKSKRGPLTKTAFLSKLLPQDRQLA